jgi:hypothetical protein
MRLRQRSAQCMQRIKPFNICGRQKKVPVTPAYCFVFWLDSSDTIIKGSSGTLSAKITHPLTDLPLRFAMNPVGIAATTATIVRYSAPSINASTVFGS